MRRKNGVREESAPLYNYMTVISVHTMAMYMYSMWAIIQIKY